MDRRSSSNGNQRRGGSGRNRMVKQHNTTSPDSETSQETGEHLDCRFPVDSQREAGETDTSPEGEEPAFGVGKKDMSEDEKPLPNGNGNGNGKKGYKEFERLFDGQDKEACRVAIFSHACPDPDAIASMMGISWLLEKAFGIESQMFYAGEVSHPQNGSMVNLLSPPLQRVCEYQKEKFDINILVDTIPSHAGVGKNKVDFQVVIDHHRELPHDFEGVLIHKKCGSCASIVYDLIKSIVPRTNWFTDEVDADIKVATALIAGIMTDTNFMMSEDCTEYELNAFKELFEYRNAGFLHQIVFFKRRKFWIDRKAEACAHAKIDEEGCAVVGLGLIPEKERDLIADMAEEMVSWASVETAVAFGVVGGDRIEGSVRSLNASLNVSEFCKKLGAIHGTGGGKHGKGAYQLPLAGFSIDPDEEPADTQDAWESIRKRESKRIMRVLKK
jgi:nanoRNase/pAp phosphatase (c-di-AMP/oligoRNAs hydrolase)